MEKIPSMEKRVMKEYMLMKKDSCLGLTLLESKNSLKTWIVEIKENLENLYKNQKHTLKFKFTNKYPFEAPQVTFVGNNIPIHPHVYSNGHICLSILAEDWSPALTVQSICLSIISMLNCQEKKRPKDNDYYVRHCSKNPKNSTWIYHDFKI